MNEETKQLYKFSSKKIYESFYDVLKYSNYKILKCYKLLMNMRNIKSNIGFIISFAFFCCYTIWLVIFIFQRINPLKRKLKKDLQKKYGKNNSSFNMNINYLLYPSLEIHSFKKISFKFDKTKINNKKYAQNIRKTSHNKEKIKKSTSKNYLLKRHQSNKKKSLANKIQNKNSIENIKSIKNIKYSDFELNELKYEEAIKKRTFNYIHFF